MNDNTTQNATTSPATTNNPPPTPPPVPPPPAPVPPPPAPVPPPPVQPPCCPLLHQPPPPRKSRAGKVGCLLAIVFCAIAFFATMAIIGVIASAMDKLDLSSGSTITKPAPKIVTEVIRPGGGPDTIAVISVNGVITSSDVYQAASARRICNELRYAREDDSVVAIIIDMNTPGGEVTASDEILNEVRQCRDAGKPVVTCMHALGASGGYFIASGSDWIIANRHTFTGSIGVIMSTLNYTALLDKIGVQSEVYRSGAMKDMLNGGRPRTELEKTYVQELIIKTFTEFAQVVADGRHKAFANVDAVKAATFADGRVLTGASALQEGLVDQLGYFDDAIAKATELSGAIAPAIVSYSQRASFLDVLLSMKLPGALDLRQVAPVRGVSIEPGKPYFLAPEFL